MFNLIWLQSYEGGNDRKVVEVFNDLGLEDDSVRELLFKEWKDAIDGGFGAPFGGDRMYHLELALGRAADCLLLANKRYSDMAKYPLSEQVQLTRHALCLTLFLASLQLQILLREEPGKPTEFLPLLKPVVGLDRNDWLPDAVEERDGAGIVRALRQMLNMHECRLRLAGDGITVESSSGSQTIYLSLLPEPIHPYVRELLLEFLREGLGLPRHCPMLKLYPPDDVSLRCVHWQWQKLSPKPD